MKFIFIFINSITIINIIHSIQAQTNIGLVTPALLTALSFLLGKTQLLATEMPTCISTFTMLVTPHSSGKRRAMTFVQNIVEQIEKFEGATESNWQKSNLANIENLVHHLDRMPQLLSIINFFLFNYNLTPFPF